MPYGLQFARLNLKGLTLEQENTGTQTFSSGQGLDFLSLLGLILNWMDKRAEVSPESFQSLDPGAYTPGETLPKESPFSFPEEMLSSPESEKETSLLVTIRELLYEGADLSNEREVAEALRNILEKENLQSESEIQPEEGLPIFMLPEGISEQNVLPGDEKVERKNEDSLRFFLFKASNLQGWPGSESPETVILRENLQRIQSPEEIIPEKSPLEVENSMEVPFIVIEAESVSHSEDFTRESLKKSFLNNAPYLHTEKGNYSTTPEIPEEKNRTLSQKGIWTVNNSTVEKADREAENPLSGPPEPSSRPEKYVERGSTVFERERVESQKTAPKHDLALHLRSEESEISVDGKQEDFPTFTSLSARESNHMTIREGGEIHSGQEERISSVRLGELIREFSLEVHPSGEKKARIKLEPPELGEVEIDLKVHRGEVKLLLTVEKPEAARELHLHLPHLREALEEAGFKLADFQVGVFSGHTGRETLPQNQDRSEYAYENRKTEKIRGPEESRGPEVRSSYTEGLLNIVI